MKDLAVWIGTAALLLAVTGAPPGRAAEPVVAYTVVDGERIPESLTGAPGDPERGRLLYAAPRAGCATCHGMPGASGDGAQSADGLAEVGARLGSGEIRLWLVAPEMLDPDTAMPAYYAAGQRRDPRDPLYGGPALTAAEIEDLVAYLAGLGGG